MTMNRISKNRIFCCLILLMASSVVHACSLPVFRYALENWEDDNHILFLPADASEEVIEKWRALKKRVAVEFDIEQADSDDGRPPGLYLSNGMGLWLSYEELGVKGTQFPTDEQMEKKWSNASSLKVINGLLSGDSIVFLISGGDEAARQAAEKKIRPRVATLLEYITLAEDVVESWKNFHSPPDEFYSPPRGHVSSAVPLGMAVSFVQLASNEPLAKQVRAMFTIEQAHEDKLGKAETVFVTAVFGRGRAIPICADDEITNSIIDQILYFVTGSCSCKIKEENPGYDLQLPIYWDDHLWESTSKIKHASEHRIIGQMLDPKTLKPKPEGQGPEQVEPATEQLDEVVYTPEQAVAPIENTDAAAASSAEGDQGAPRYVVIVGVLLALCAGLFFFIRMKK